MQKKILSRKFYLDIILLKVNHGQHLSSWQRQPELKQHLHFTTSSIYHSGCGGFFCQLHHIFHFNHK